MVRVGQRVLHSSQKLIQMSQMRLNQARTGLDLAQVLGGGSLVSTSMRALQPARFRGSHRMHLKYGDMTREINVSANYLENREMLYLEACHNRLYPIRKPWDKWNQRMSLETCQCAVAKHVDWQSYNKSLLGKWISIATAGQKLPDSVWIQNIKWHKNSDSMEWKKHGMKKHGETTCSPEMLPMQLRCCRYRHKSLNKKWKHGPGLSKVRWHHSRRTITQPSSSALAASSLVLCPALTMWWDSATSKLRQLPAGAGTGDVSLSERQLESPQLEKTLVVWKAAVLWPYYPYFSLMHHFKPSPPQLL